MPTSHKNIKKLTELGIDEAGRGCVLGPLVMAGVVVTENGRELLAGWGVQDSKTFGSSKKAHVLRSQLAEKISAQFESTVIAVSSDTVDRYVHNSSLNVLEQETAAKIISNHQAELVILDGENLFKPLVTESIVARNKADQDFISVSAASILAKVERDSQLEALCNPFREEFGEIKGGGYANAKTLEFVNWYLKKFNELPEFYRKSYNWKALKSGN